MTTTYSILSMGTTNELINIDTLDRSQLTRSVKGSKELANGGSRRVFRLSTSDPTQPLYIEIDSIYDEKGGELKAGETRFTVRLISRQVITDDTTGEELYNAPIQVGLFITTEGQGFRDTSALMSLIMNLFSLVHDGTIVSNEVATTVLDRWAQFGVEDTFV